jgi:hypothetical protein
MGALPTSSVLLLKFPSEWHEAWLLFPPEIGLAAVVASHLLLPAL